MVIMWTGFNFVCPIQFVSWGALHPAQGHVRLTVHPAQRQPAHAEDDFVLQEAHDPPLPAVRARPLLPMMVMTSNTLLV